MLHDNFTDKDILTDALSSQKFITENYNTWANECAAPGLKSTFMNILEEEHNIQHEVFCEMQSKGWYQTPQAEQQKIDQAKQKYTANQCNS